MATFTASFVRVTHYTVTNRATGKTTKYKTRNGASRAADRMDDEYGSYICTKQAHYA
jgi:hypothetical protein